MHRASAEPSGESKSFCKTGTSALHIYLSLYDFPGIFIQFTSQNEFHATLSPAGSTPNLWKSSCHFSLCFIHHHQPKPDNGKQVLILEWLLLLLPEDAAWMGWKQGNMHFFWGLTPQGWGMGRIVLCLINVVYTQCGQGSGVCLHGRCSCGLRRLNKSKAQREEKVLHSRNHVSVSKETDVHTEQGSEEESARLAFRGIPTSPWNIFCTSFENRQADLYKIRKSLIFA